MAKDIEREAFKLEMIDDYNMREVDTPFGKDFAFGSTKQAFKVWQAAKARSVPEEFILVSKTPSLKVLDRLYAEHDIDEERATYIYRDIIDAQEPAND